MLFCCHCQQYYWHWRIDKWKELFFLYFCCLICKIIKTENRCRRSYWFISNIHYFVTVYRDWKELFMYGIDFIFDKWCQSVGNVGIYMVSLLIQFNLLMQLYLDAFALVFNPHCTSGCISVGRITFWPWRCVLDLDLKCFSWILLISNSQYRSHCLRYIYILHLCICCRDCSYT